jgi:hypothetical protein
VSDTACGVVGTKTCHVDGGCGVFYSCIVIIGVQWSSVANADDYSGNNAKQMYPAIKGKPWEEPQNTHAAVNNHDHYAWRLFVAVNWPANENNCRPDRRKRLGDDGLASWEVWQTREETFLEGAQKPANWKQGCKE